VENGWICWRGWIEQIWIVCWIGLSSHCKQRRK
jgi:hypothetical protein